MIEDEIQTEEEATQPSPRIERTAAQRRSDRNASIAAASLIGLTIAGVGALNTDAARDWRDQETQDAKQRGYIEAVTDATNAQYSSDSLIKDFTLESGGLEDPALDVIHKALGDGVYNDVKPLIYDTLHASALIQTKQSQPQPGDTFVVVTTDIDPEANDGQEYVIVKPSQINYGEVSSLPVPEQDNQ